VPSKEKLGSSAGIDVPAASACIVEVGDSLGLVKEISSRLEDLKRRGRSE